MGAEGLILDLDADKGVEVEDGDRVVKGTNQVSTFTASVVLECSPGVLLVGNVGGAGQTEYLTRQDERLGTHGNRLLPRFLEG